MSDLEDKPKEIHCLLSVGENQTANAIELISEANALGVLMHIVWRGGAPKIDREINSYRAFESEDCSLSHARNILIRNMGEDANISSDAIVFFADDDGRLPTDFRTRVEENFSPGIKWALGTYGPNSEDIDTSRFPPEPLTKLSQKEILRLASSLGIYVTFDLLMQAGLFDENLGVGSRISVGEDTEFVFRLRKISGDGLYSPNLLQFHPYKTRSDFHYLATASFLYFMALRSPKFIYPALRYSVNMIYSNKINLRAFIRIIRKECQFRFLK